MNTDTGQIYRGPEAIRAAQQRGEPVVPVSERVARAQEVGERELGRRERRAAERAEKREARKKNGVRRI